MIGGRHRAAPVARGSTAAASAIANGVFAASIDFTPVLPARPWPRAREPPPPQLARQAPGVATPIAPPPADADEINGRRPHRASLARAGPCQVAVGVDSASDAAANGVIDRARSPCQRTRVRRRRATVARRVARGREGRARVTSAPDWWAGYVKVSHPLRVR
jgi:hypothetical protein